MRAGDPPSVGELKLVALGGLGEIGMNCLVLEQRALLSAGDELERLVIDCGVMFPGGDAGVDLYHPRFDYLLDEPAAPSLVEVRGVVLTHAHEDHFGAVTLFVHERARRHPSLGPLRIWGPPYVVELLRARLEEERIDERTTLVSIAPGERFRGGSFDVEAIRVTHSVVDALALSIGTAAGRVVHTGDFKLDDDPPDGESTDVARLEAMGREGVALLLSDSTNAAVDGCAGGERGVAHALERVVAAASHRVVVGVFASNAHRMAAVGSAARAHGRRLCLLGRSMHTHSEVARALGRLDWPSDLLIAPELAARLPRHQVLYLATGTQGEPRAALRRLASGQHPDVRLEPGDSVVFSSRVIPGNERAVQALIDDLLTQGVRVLSWHRDRQLHVSGHAHRDEQRRMIELTRPAAFVPLHGTRLHLEEHAAMARELGVAEVLVMANGEAAFLAGGRLRRGAPVPAGKIGRAGQMTIDEDALRERRQMARAGAVFVALTKGARKVAVVRARGVPALAASEAERAVRDALASARRRADSVDAVIGEVERAVRQRLGALLGHRPPVEVVVLS